MRRTIYGLVVFVILGGIMFSAHGAESPGDAHMKSKSKLRIAPWVVGSGEKMLAMLKEKADIIDAISLFGSFTPELKELCRQNGIEMYQAVGGNEHHVTPKGRANFINTWVQAVEERGLDGIDLDLEHLDPGIKNMYSLLLRGLSAALHEKGKKLSMCVGYYHTMEEKNFVFWFDPQVIGETCDHVRIMGYDMYYAPAKGKNSPTFRDRPDCLGAGPNTTLPWARDAINYWLRYVPKEHLIFGIPAYSNVYNMTPEGGGRHVYGNPVNAVEELKAPGSKVDKYWMWHEKINAYRYTGKDGDPYLLYACDEESTAWLIDLVLESGISGIAMWHFTKSYPEMWDVIYKKAGMTTK